MKLGEVKPWKLINYDDKHNFHIYVSDFQLISVNQKPNEVPEL